jgi:hypothetical protein
MTKIEEIEARRAARKAELEAAQNAQLEKDLEAFEALEIEHGANNVARLVVKAFTPGLPTFVVVRSPGGTSFYKRYVDMVRRAQKNTQAIGAAQDMLAESSIVYPSDEATRKAMFEQFPGVRVTAAVRALKFVELEEEDEKKD